VAVISDVLPEPVVVTVVGVAVTDVWNVVDATGAVWVMTVEFDVPWADSVAVTLQNPAVVDDV
jgi:hypothetical protein